MPAGVKRATYLRLEACRSFRHISILHDIMYYFKDFLARLSEHPSSRRGITGREWLFDKHARYRVLFGYATRWEEPAISQPPDDTHLDLDDPTLDLDSLPLTSWYTASDAAAALSLRSRRTVKPDYLRSLVRAGVAIRTRKMGALGSLSPVRCGLLHRRSQRQESRTRATGQEKATRSREVDERCMQVQIDRGVRRNQHHATIPQNRTVPKSSRRASRQRELLPRSCCVRRHQ